MSYTVIIPSRYASTRLPGKPLLDIAGKPMIQRVYEQALKSTASRVIIATDSEAIATVAAGFGAEVCMTSADHPSGTDRIQEVAQRMQLPLSEIVVNVQGDEPLIPPAVIDQVAANLKNHGEAAIATLCEPIESLEMLLDPGVVKVVSNDQGMALYFSRAPIPWPRDEFANGSQTLPNGRCWFRHLGIYAYRVELLNSYVQWPPADIENTEKLEQLRAIAHGVNIHIAEAVEAVPGGIDTELDLKRVNTLLGGAV
jgi:3-deoxy-manno-octulosonate cytidylyltransferase (CMP-KDO synthetase)